MSDTVLNLPAGLQFRVGSRIAAIDGLALSAGEWIAITPEVDDVADGPAPPVARLLATLGSPVAGSIELLGVAIKSLSYVDLQQVRKRLGFVGCRGGLLSNRTLAENISLPLAVHSNLGHDEEAARVSWLLGEFDLSQLSARRPHEVDGDTRFRTCVARALALSPEWIVVEGTGDFHQPRGRSWPRLEAFRTATPSALAVCLQSADPRFEEWFTSVGGRVIRYRLLPEAT